MLYNRDRYDAVVVGAGPNGLAAAITLARKFRSVLLVEAKETVGGGTRSAELTLPGFIHDVCSAVQPLALSSPFFRQLELHRHGLEWIHPEIPLAHPFGDGEALCLHRSLEATADALGPDGRAYREMLQPFVENHERLLSDVLKPLPIPEHPILMARFGLQALRSARNLAEAKFRSARVRALFAGLAAHAMIPLDQAATAAFGILLAVLAHGVGWPIVKGGSQKLADALADCFREKGGEIRTGISVGSLGDLPGADHYFFDVTPRQLLNIGGLDLAEGYRRRLSRFRYGPGVCKVDWALSAPIPWKADVCRKAGTVHLGGSFEEIDAASWCAEAVARHGFTVEHPAGSLETAVRGRLTGGKGVHVVYDSVGQTTFEKGLRNPAKESAGPREPICGLIDRDVSRRIRCLLQQLRRHRHHCWDNFAICRHYA